MSKTLFAIEKLAHLKTVIIKRGILRPMFNHT